MLRFGLRGVWTTQGRSSSIRSVALRYKSTEGSPKTEKGINRAPKQGHQIPENRTREFIKQKMQEQQQMQMRMETKKMAVQPEADTTYDSSTIESKFPELQRINEEAKQRKDLVKGGFGLRKSWWERIKYHLKYGHAAHLIYLLIGTSMVMSMAIHSKKDAERLLNDKRVKEEGYQMEIANLEKHIQSLQSGAPTQHAKEPRMKPTI